MFELRPLLFGTFRVPFGLVEYVTLAIAEAMPLLGITICKSGMHNGPKFPQLGRLRRILTARFCGEAEQDTLETPYRFLDGSVGAVNHGHGAVVVKRLEVL